MATSFKKLYFAEKEFVTSQKLNEMADNDAFLNKRKVEGSLRNVNSEGDPLANPQFFSDNIVMYAEYREISPSDEFPEKQSDKSISNKFEKRIKFPKGFFNPNYMPVVVASIGILSGIKAVSIIVKDVDSSGFTATIMEYSGKNFTESMKFFINYIVFGVKN